MEFTHHTKTAYGAILAAIILAVAGEIIPIHLLLSRITPILAWAATASSVYAVFWLLRDYAQLKRTRFVVQDDVVHLNFGARWQITIPKQLIESVQPIAGGVTTEKFDARLALPGARLVRMQLREPVTAHGPFGITKPVRTLKLGPDDPQRFIAALTTGGVARSVAP